MLPPPPLPPSKRSRAASPVTVSSSEGEDDQRAVDLEQRLRALREVPSTTEPRQLYGPGSMYFNPQAGGSGMQPPPPIQVDIEQLLDNMSMDTLSEQSDSATSDSGSDTSGSGRRRRRRGASNIGRRARRSQAQRLARAQERQEPMETSSQDEEQQSQEQERDAQHPRVRQRERQEEAASRKKRSKTYGVGLGSLEDIQESQLIGVLAAHNTGPMDKVCPHCRALLLPGEPPRICCNKGDIVVEPRRPPPEDLCGGLFDEASIQQTRKYAKWINTHLAMASVVITEVRERGYNPTLKIEGRICLLYTSPSPRDS